MSRIKARLTGRLASTAMIAVGLLALFGAVTAVHATPSHAPVQSAPVSVNDIQWG
jgi:hypothetical protein